MKALFIAILTKLTKLTKIAKITQPARLAQPAKLTLPVKLAIIILFFVSFAFMLAKDPNLTPLNPKAQDLAQRPQYMKQIQPQNPSQAQAQAQNKQQGSTQNPFQAQPQPSLFYTHYERYKYGKLTHRRIKHADILPVIRSLEEDSRFVVSKEGESIQGRDIFLVKAGQGPTTVLLWSQMHGNEPTGTLAMLDIFNFIQEPGQELEALRDSLLNELSIYFIPMLNPDGAEVFQRRNAIGLDLNRDALQLQSPESQLLKSVRDRIDAHWGFNLHDQDLRHAAGKSPKPASISFLAPPYDGQESINEVRSRAMQLIVGLNQILQTYIPGQVGKWADGFEPRAFGDKMQQWGTSTILIEGGGYRHDPERQYVRKLNFVALMEGLQGIASGAYAAHPMEEYYKIPENEGVLFNLIIRQAQVKENGQWYSMDIGINRQEVTVERGNFYFKSSIEELGDMSGFYGYEELDATGMQLEAGKIYPRVFADMQALEKEDLHQLLQSGYTSVRMQELPTEGFSRLPLNILPLRDTLPGVDNLGTGNLPSGNLSTTDDILSTTDDNLSTDDRLYTDDKLSRDQLPTARLPAANLAEEDAKEFLSLSLAARPNFVLKEQGVLRYVIVNGFIYDVHDKGSEKHGSGHGVEKSNADEIGNGANNALVGPKQ